MASCNQCESEGLLLWTRDGALCPQCAESEPLRPSGRQRKLVGRGLFFSALAQGLLFPWATLGILAGAFLLALRKKIEGLWKTAPGIVALFFFWILLLPSLLQNPDQKSLLVVLAFLLLTSLLQLPGLLLVRNMILRGHGLLAGSTLAALLLPVLFSFLLVLLGLLESL